MSQLSEFGPARVKTKGSVTFTGPHAEDGGKYLDENGPSTAISTYTGHAFDIHDSTTWTYDPQSQTNDIAMSLSCLARYNGHVHFYSVAEHSIRVADHLKADGHDLMTQLLGLWHDATEAYLGDIPRPQKRLMHVSGLLGEMVPFEELEDSLARSLFEHHGIEWSEDRWATVKAADYAVYVMERSERPSPATVGKYAMGPKVADTNWHNRNSSLRVCLADS